MSNGAENTSPTIVPGLRYKDAPAAIAWLCAAFGFESKMVIPAGPGLIAHAQLTFGNGMIMLGSATDSDQGMGQRVKPPTAMGGVNTQAAYVIVDDADAHHERAIAAGAVVVLPLVDQDYGGRGYTCTDPEGHIWSFGTYDPWA